MKIKIITDNDCPNCQQIKKMLKSKNIVYEEINKNNLSKEELDNLIKRGCKSLPIILDSDKGYKILTLAEIINYNC